MNEQLREIVNLFGAFVFSMKGTLKRTIDMSADLLYGESESDQGKYLYVSIPLRSFDNTGIDKDDLDKLFSIMAFFVDNTIGSANIYLTTRNERLVIEIAW
jgi:hypothetical protein